MKAKRIYWANGNTFMTPFLIGLVYVGEFSSEEDARDAIRRKRVTGMSYAKISEHKPGKARKADRLLALEKIKLNGFLIESSVYKSHSGKTAGCRNCGSSFPRDYFIKNRKYRYNDLMLAYMSTIALYAVIICVWKQPKSAFRDTEKKIRKSQERAEETGNDYYLGCINTCLG